MTDQTPLLHDDFQRCEQCGEIVLIHGKGECLELDDVVYCPRHAKPHMDESDWHQRWGESMRLLHEIRSDHRKAIKYHLPACPAFYVVHQKGMIYEAWRRCEQDDERNYTTYSESSLVRDIERRATFSNYVNDPPKLVSAAHAPINATVPNSDRAVRMAYEAI